MWVIVLVMVFITFCFKLSNAYKYWENKGVPYVKPLPIFGNFASIVFRRRAFPHITEDLYYAYPNKRYVGMYQFLKPTLVLRDPELIKTITVREFETFPDHSVFDAKDVDYWAGKILFNMTSDDGWKDMRTAISPAFTSSKMKGMFVLMGQCAESFTNHFKRQGSLVTIDIKDAFTRFTNDVIATTAFGITCNSLKEPNNDFYLMGKKLTDFSGLRSLIFLGVTVSPKLMKLLKVKLFKEEVCTFFKKIIKETLKLRQENKISRPDLIQQLMKARSNGLRNDHQNNCPYSQDTVELKRGKPQRLRNERITHDDIIAHSIGFYFAGFDTSSNLLCYIAYELALNLDIQKKLQEEVDSVLTSCNGNLTYEALLQMKYLDCVVSETLRKWPPVIITDRKSAKPFTINPEHSNEKAVHLEKGTSCWIPIYAIHRDAKYYPDPEKFDPERFSNENRPNIKPFTYIPFGAGPRNCIGTRFSILESKLLIAKILQVFEIVPVEKTQIPVEVSRKNITLIPDDGIWLGLKSRITA